MSTQPQFLIDFEEKMAKLGNIKRNMQASIQFKEKFTSDLKDRLVQINQRIQELANLISKLKENSDALQGQVNENTSSISQKESELASLKQQIQDLQNERDSLNDKLNQQKQELDSKISQQQQMIDASEEQLRNITAERDSLKTQLDTSKAEADALRTELSSKGDLQQQHAEEIQRITQQSEQQLKDQEQQLMQKINDCEGKIAAFEQQIREKDEANARVQQELAANQTSATTSAQALQKQIDDLTALNETLIERIQQATQAISDAADDLENISNIVPNTTTKQEVDALLNEIERSIENIGRAVQGQPPQGVNRSQIALPIDTPVTITDMNSKQNIDMTLGRLINLLSIKATQQRRSNPNAENKYADALEILQQETDPNNIDAALVGIVFKNGTFMGGRKTKKMRKQKGGFTYKKSSKRKSITSKSSPRKTSRRSFRMTSRITSRRF